MITVLENDNDTIPSWLKTSLGNRDYDVWYNFSMTFHWDKAGAFERLKDLGSSDMFVASPSFVGGENSFESHLLLFMKLKEMNIPISLSILYTGKSFDIFLLEFLSNEHSALKKENNHRLIKEVLGFHKIYSIPYVDYVAADLDERIQITYESLMVNYIETHRKLKPTEFKYKDGLVYPAYYVDYKYPIGETEVTLLIEGDYNNRTKLKDLRP